jgi:hypothetical protein
LDRRFRGAYCLHHHRPVDGGSTHLWNVDQHQLDYMAVDPRRLWTSSFSFSEISCSDGGEYECYSLVGYSAVCLVVGPYESSTRLWNVGVLQRDCTVLYPRRLVILKFFIFLALRIRICSCSHKYGINF